MVQKMHGMSGMMEVRLAPAKSRLHAPKQVVQQVLSLLRGELGTKCVEGLLYFHPSSSSVVRGSLILPTHARLKWDSIFAPTADAGRRLRLCGADWEFSNAATRQLLRISVCPGSRKKRRMAAALSRACAVVSQHLTAAAIEAAAITRIEKLANESPSTSKRPRGDGGLATDPASDGVDHSSKAQEYLARASRQHAEKHLSAAIVKAALAEFDSAITSVEQAHSELSRRFQALQPLIEEPDDTFCDPGPPFCGKDYNKDSSDSTLLLFLGPSRAVLERTEAHHILSARTIQQLLAHLWRTYGITPHRLVLADMFGFLGKWVTFVLILIKASANDCIWVGLAVEWCLALARVTGAKRVLFFGEVPAVAHALQRRLTNGQVVRRLPHPGRARFQSKSFDGFYAKYLDDLWTRLVSNAEPMAPRRKEGLRPHPSSEAEVAEVTTTPSGKCYHSYPNQCGGSGAHHAVTSLKEVKQRGLTPCKQCRNKLEAAGILDVIKHFKF